MRAKEYIFKAQLYAEDGAVWLADAHNYGLKSLFMPLNGFFHTFERIFGVLVSSLPLRLAPLLFNLSALLIFFFTCYYLFSKRTRLVTNNYQMLFLAASLCLIANVDEFFFNFSNSVFLLGIIGLCILIARPSKMRAVGLLEKFIYTVICFTLPFSWFYLIALLADRFIYHKKRLFFLLVTTAGATAQLLVYLFSHSQRSNITFISLLSEYSMLEIYNQIIVPSLRFARIDITVTQFNIMFLVWVIFCIVLVFAATCVVLLKANKELRYLLLFLAAMTAASLKSPIISAPNAVESIKYMSVAPFGDRYFIFGIIALSLVLAHFSFLSVKKTFMYGAAVAFFGAGMISSFIYNDFFIQKNFVDLRSSYSDNIRHGQQSDENGVTQIDINPVGWQIRLNNKGLRY